MEGKKKAHAVCIPLPCQGHINPMLHLAKLLHSAGFYVTFVHTEFNYRHHLAANPTAHDGFRFETVADGLPPDNKRGILDLPDLCAVMPTRCLMSFRELILKLNDCGSPEIPPVSCIVSDGVMGFTLKVAEEFGIPEVLLFTPSACGMLGYLHFRELIQRGYFPLKDESCLSNGYLDTELDWIPEMKGIRLKDLPAFIRTTNRNDIMFNYNLEAVANALRTKTMILNTFDALEQQVLAAVKRKFPTLYTIGPLSMIEQKLCKKTLDSIDSNLWKQDSQCLEWLDRKGPGSVVYVNFGSLVTLTSGQLTEFASGLANSKLPFLWVIRPNLVEGGREILSKNFVENLGDRGLLVKWCPQEKVLSHRSIGLFLTHCGWNSVLESIGEGVPMVCWPFFAEQQTNCFEMCRKWGVGMEIDSEVRRDEVERVVLEMMKGNEGKKIRGKCLEWKKKAKEAIMEGGSSYTNFNLLVKYLKKE